MPFVAKNKDTGGRVDITTIENPRDILKGIDMICQFEDCGREMIVKAGLVKAAHFAHKHIDGDACLTSMQSHPEGPDHLLLKRFIADFLKKQTIYYDAKIEYEYPVYEARRIIDVAAVFPDGWVVAHEAQLAGITTEQLMQRTQDYKNAGIEVFWWLGNTADTETNRQWCITHGTMSYLRAWFKVEEQTIPVRWQGKDE